MSDARLAELTQLTRTLTGRLAAEAAAFEARRPQDIAGDLAETQRLANVYRHESARLKRDPAPVAAASAAARQALKSATEAFETTLARHGRALEAARVITEGLVKALAEEVAALRPQSSGYGPGVRAAASRSAVAVTLDSRA